MLQAGGKSSGRSRARTAVSETRRIKMESFTQRGKEVTEFGTGTRYVLSADARDDLATKLKNNDFNIKNLDVVFAACGHDYLIMTTNVRIWVEAGTQRQSAGRMKANMLHIGTQLEKMGASKRLSTALEGRLITMGYAYGGYNY
jgi:hypothetical protein